MNPLVGGGTSTTGWYILYFPDYPFGPWFTNFLFRGLVCRSVFIRVKFSLEPNCQEQGVGKSKVFGRDGVGDHTVVWVGQTGVSWDSGSSVT